MLYHVEAEVEVEVPIIFFGFALDLSFSSHGGIIKSPVSPSFFFALPGIGIYGANSNKPITERFSNCPSMASMTN